MSIFSRRGDYRLSQQGDRSVTSRVRRTSSAFTPACRTSRFDVFDADLQYEVELRDGQAWLRVGDGDFALIEVDDRIWGLSYQDRRDGVPLKRVDLDMIVASRGRLLAKERQTDRIFHLLIDHLFRTAQTEWRDVRGSVDPATPWLDEYDPSSPSVTEPLDPPVPSNYLKLDPEFFTEGTGFKVPWPLSVDYDNHPASVRFPAFSKLLKSQTSDFMCVVVVPRIWYLIDSRSPLQVFDMRDLECIGDDELKNVVVEDRLRAMLFDALNEVIIPDILEDLEASIRQQIDGLVPSEANALGDDLRDVIGRIRAARNTTKELVEDVPGIGSLLGPILGALGDIGDATDDVKAAVLARLETVVAAMRTLVIDKLVEGASGISAHVGALFLNNQIQTHGFAGLVMPSLFTLALGYRRLEHEGVVGYDLASSTGCSPRTTAHIDIDKALDTGTETDNRPLRGMLNDLLLAGRNRRGATAANDVPGNVPSYVNVSYEKLFPITPPLERTAIDFTEVLDLGIGAGHWAEHWIENYGGEIHNIYQRRPLLQGEQFSLAMFRFLNGPVDDGDCFVDGTTNFFMLVRLRNPSPRSPGVSNPKPRYAIVWLDEQSYFTQRWRLLHPTLDCDGDFASMVRQLRFTPEIFRFDIKRFWDPFENDCINERSRMCVARQIIAVTGHDPGQDLPEVFTICFAFGMCDRTWRWRALPPVPTAHLADDVAQTTARLNPSPTNVVYVNTLGLREDTTLYFRGFFAQSGRPIEGRWFQRYLPCDARHLPAGYDLEAGQRPSVGFNHPWNFVSEEAFRHADKFYNFGIFERGPSDSRSQYYEVDLLQSFASDPTQIVWTNEPEAETVNPNLHADTITFGWSAFESDQPVTFGDLIDDRTKGKTFSLHEKKTRLRLLKRPPLGLIAVFLDKRDDDLQAASHLPHETKLVEDTSDIAVRLAGSVGPFSKNLQTPVQNAHPRQLRVLVRAHHRVTRAPAVYKAAVSRRRVGQNDVFTLRFWTPLSVDEVHRALWLCTLGALENDGSIVSLLSVEVFGTFVRQGVPSTRLPANFTSADILKPEYEYKFDWTPSPQLAQSLRRLCRPRGRIENCTSIWFEDVVGHRSTPDVLEFLA